MKTTEPLARKPKNQNKSIGIVGAQFSFGQKHKGVEKASSYIRYNGLNFITESLFHKTRDYGDIFQESKKTTDFIKNEDDLFRLYKLCKNSIQENNFSLFLGGDHSVGLSTVAAVKAVHKDAIVIWIDAHADLNTPESSLSNNLHGMPVSFLLGLNQTSYPMNFNWAHSKLSPKDIIYAGVRDLDSAELETISNMGITALTTSKLKTHGIRNAINMALNKIDPKKKLPIHISFDVDSLDPQYVNSTGVKAKNGLSVVELQSLVSELATRKVVSMDFVELNPDLADNEMQLKSEINILFQMLLGLHPYLSTYNEVRLQH